MTPSLRVSLASSTAAISGIFCKLLGIDGPLLGLFISAGAAVSFAVMDALWPPP